MRTGRAWCCTVLLGLAACAARGPEFDPSLLTPEPGRGRLIVYRMPGGYGSGTWPEIRIGDSSVGTLRHGGYVERSLDPGEAGTTRVAVSAVRRSVMTWPFNTGSLEVSLAAGEIVFVELDMQGASDEVLLQCGETDDRITFCTAITHTPILKVVPGDLARPQVVELRANGDGRRL